MWWRGAGPARSGRKDGCRFRPPYLLRFITCEGIRRPKETAITTVMYDGVDQVRAESISWRGRFRVLATGLMGTAGL